MSMNTTTADTVITNEMKFSQINADPSVRDAVWADLASSNILLVMAQVNKMCKRYEMDDAISAGTIGLMNAIKTFDSDNGAKFSTYATTCIRNEIRLFLRRESNQRKKVAGYTQTLDPTGYKVDQKPRNSLIDSDDLYEMIEKANLTDRERAILNYRFGLNGYEMLTLIELAPRMGICDTRIQQIEKKVLARIETLIQNSHNLT